MNKENFVQAILYKEFKAWGTNSHPPHLDLHYLQIQQLPFLELSVFIRKLA